VVPCTITVSTRLDIEAEALTFRDCTVTIAVGPLGSFWLTTVLGSFDGAALEVVPDALPVVGGAAAETAGPDHGRFAPR